MKKYPTRIKTKKVVARWKKGNLLILKENEREHWGQWAECRLQPVRCTACSMIVRTRWHRRAFLFLTSDFSIGERRRQRNEEARRMGHVWVQTIWTRVLLVILFLRFMAFVATSTLSCSSYLALLFSLCSSETSHFGARIHNGNTISVWQAKGVREGNQDIINKMLIAPRSPKVFFII